MTPGFDIFPAAEAHRVFEDSFARNGRAKPWSDHLVGTPEQIFERLRPYLGIGYRHLIVGFPSPYDTETMERMATEVRPLLEAA